MPFSGSAAWPGLADHLDLQVQAAVVRGRDAVAEARGNRVIRAADVLAQQPRRTDRAARFLVVREMQLDGTVERRALRSGVLQRAQRECVGGEIGLRHRHAASVHEAVANLGAIGIGGPPRAGLHDVAVRIERDHRAACPSPKRTRTTRLVQEIMPFAAPRPRARGGARPRSPSPRSNAAARAACGAQSPGGLSEGTFTSSARNCSSSPRGARQGSRECVAVGVDGRHAA